MNCAESISWAMENEDEKAFLKNLKRCLEGKVTKTHGVYKTSEILKISKEVSKLAGQVSPEFVLKLWRASMEGEKDIVFGMKSGRHVRLFLIGMAYNLDSDFKRLFLSLAAPHLGDWESCDQLAMKVAAPLALKNEDFLGKLKGYLEHKNPWTRRLPLATIPPLIKKKPSLSGKLLSFVGMSLKDREYPVRKACRWVLREIYKVDPEAVVNFAKKHEDERICFREFLKKKT